MTHLPFTILKPVSTYPTIQPRLHATFTSSQMQVVLGALAPGEFLSVDFETNGDTGKEGTYPVGVAMASAARMDYVDFRTAPQAYELIMRTLWEKEVPLLAHNVYFDAAWPLRDFGVYLNWKYCTYALFKHLANEGWPGQEWGLKYAQKQLLGWAETNEVELDKWLIDNGHFSSVSAKEKQGYVFYPQWPVGKEFLPRYVSPKKGEMYQAPLSVLGHYACLDAWSTHALFYKVLKPALDEFQEFKRYYDEVYPEYTRILLVQKLRGMQLDTNYMTSYSASLQGEIDMAAAAILAHPQVAKAVKERRAVELKEIEEAEPPRYKKRKGKETPPAQFTKDGRVAKAYTKWVKRQAEPLEESYHWQIWLKRKEEFLASPLMKLGSGDDRRWLLYEKLGFPVEVYTDNEENPQPATDEDALLGMGEIGKLFIQWQDRVKVSQFVEKLQELKWSDGTLHPSFRVPGTLTGRLGGNDPNIQNQPKDLPFLRIYKARPGYKLVTCDVTSLENYVLAELSQDASLLRLYGPEAREGQDAYLFNVAQLPGIGDEVRATGYDPLTATKEETAKAKKENKKAREVGKVLTLSGNYGASAAKMQYSMKMRGLDYPLEEVQALHKAFWELYKGIKDYRYELERQWKKNSGWVLDGLGHPVGVHHSYLKDIVNRVVQRTGHSLFVKLLVTCHSLVEERRLDAHPWIADLHDCMIYEVADRHVPAFVQIAEIEGYRLLNEWLGAQSPLKGESKVCNSWDEDKSETAPSLFTLKNGWHREKKESQK